MEAMHQAAAPPLQPGRHCWRLAAARRGAFLIDGEDYYAALHAAVAQARHSVFILGWDIDSRLRLVQDPRQAQDTAGPAELRSFLNAVASRPDGPDIHILAWNFSLIYLMEREWLGAYRFTTRAHPRLHFHMDGQHPMGGCHHQKVVVVDDQVAFVGGFDLGRWRWDTSEHQPDDPRRTDAHGNRYPPFHDIQMLVDGDAARALGELVRWRWRRATGQTVPAAPADLPDPWPAQVTPDLQDVEVAISRTLPAYRQEAEVRETERLYLDAIVRARHWLYIENQYLTSRRIGAALARRLRMPDGPEIVMVLPLRTGGWLEQNTMDVIRTRLLKQLRQADRYHRLRVCYPDQPGLGETCISVHAKVLVVDDELVHVGSANLSDRSMGVDTECGLSVAAQGRPDIRRAIQGFRNRLLAEHLGVEPQTVATTLADRRSLTGTVDALQRPGGRTLRPLTVDETSGAPLLPDPEVIDPSAPVDPQALMDRLVPPEDHRPIKARTAALLLLLFAFIALAAAWRWTALGEWLSLGSLQRLAAFAENHALAPVWVAAGFVVGGLLVVPLTLLVLVTALAFDPVIAFFSAWAGCLLSAITTYGLGAALGQDTIQHLLGRRLRRLHRKLTHRGFWTMLTIRLLPIAPYTVVNLAAGALRIRFRDFLWGSVFGLLPGLLGLTVFVEQVQHFVENPSPKALGGVAALLVAMIGGGYLLRTRLARQDKRSASS